MRTAKWHYRRAMPANLSTVMLADVDDSYHYGASRTQCRHTARVSLTKLRAHLSGAFPGEDQTAPVVLVLRLSAGEDCVTLKS